MEGNQYWSLKSRVAIKDYLNRTLFAMQIYDVKNPGPKGLGSAPRGVEHCKISNSKHQITNKSQIPILNDQNRFGISNFGHCYLFDI
jgi:hypothetical protein